MRRWKTRGATIDLSESKGSFLGHLVQAVATWGPSRRGDGVAARTAPKHGLEARTEMRNRPIRRSSRDRPTRSVWPRHQRPAGQKPGGGTAPSVTVQHHVLAEPGYLVVVGRQVGFKGGVFRPWTPERQVRLGEDNEVDGDLVQSRDHTVQLWRRGGARVEMGKACLI